MDNKPQNVFEKLDKQSEQIDDISAKLEGISKNDLYALAKRIWGYGDYQTAQKYFNHISLLDPLDWEAPFYSFLCQYHGPHEVDFFEDAFERLGKVVVSTIQYVMDLNISADDKNTEITRCLQIVENEVIHTNDRYYRNQEIFDKYIPDILCKIESFYMTLFNFLKNYPFESMKHTRAVISDCCLDLIKKAGTIHCDLITEEVFNELIGSSEKSFDLDFISLSAQKNAKPKPLSDEEKKEIQLNGTMFFEYDDKIVSRRYFLRKAITGTILLVLSILGIILSFTSNWLYVIFFAFPFAHGLFCVLAAVTQKERINCSSVFCIRGKKNRLSSSGKVVTERKVNVISVATILIQVMLAPSCIFLIFSLYSLSNVDSFVKILLTVTVILSVIFYYVCWLILNTEHMFDGTYSYDYNGQCYRF